MAPARRRSRATSSSATARSRRVGKIAPITGVEVLDVKGMAVAPGFIDVHTHADEVADRPLAENFIRMGVTSIVAGNCGGSAVDVAAALAKIRTTQVSVNYATLVGHNSVRAAVMGRERRAPTAAELEKMRGLVRDAMSAGAVGFSTGLQYIPGTYAETAEIVELAKVAGAAGGVYASHMRNEGTAIDEAVAETIAVGEAAQCPVQISHLKIDSPSRWGQAERVLGLIDAARKRGVNVEADQYAYTAGSSNLGIRFPSWVLEGGQAQIVARLDDPAQWAKIKKETIELFEARGFKDLSFAVVATYRPDPSLNGLSIKQIAQKLRGSDTVDAQVEVAREMLKAGGAQMVYHLMSEAGRRAHHEAPDGRHRVRRVDQRAGPGRAASARLRQHGARARQIRARRQGHHAGRSRAQDDVAAGRALRVRRSRDRSSRATPPISSSSIRRRWRRPRRSRRRTRIRWACRMSWSTACSWCATGRS